MTSKPPTAGDLRLASWNIDSVRARLDHVIAWLTASSIDVVALQETKCTAARFPTAAFAEAGYEAAAVGTGGQAGVALVSRVGLDDVQLGVPGAVAPFHEPRLISATCAGLRVHGAYAPNGRKVRTEPHRKKLAWFEFFGRYLEVDGLGDQPTIVLGDLNIAPSDLDVWAPERYRKRNLTSAVERSAFQDLLDRGLVDVVRAAIGDDRMFTWWNRRSDFFATDRGWRLDHILTDPTTADAVQAVWVERSERAREKASDHAPLVIDLRVADLQPVG